MIRLSPHKARERQKAWAQAQWIIGPAAFSPRHDPAALHSWSAAGRMASLWFWIEDALWNQKHRATHQRLKAASKRQ